jgi:MarR family transcriptional regulator, transcriptional regulator for hemolysin
MSQRKPADRDASLMALTTALTNVSRSYRAAVDKAVAHAGLSQAMALPLIMLGRHGDGLRPGVLAGIVGVEGPSLVRSLAALVEAGLVEYRDDAVDGRAKTIHMKPAGVKLWTRMEAVLRDLRRELFEDVPDADVAASLRMFAALEARLDRKPGALPLMAPRNRSRAA